MFIHRYLVEEVEKASPTTVLVTLKSPSGPQFTFQPGQYAAISFTRNVRPTPARCFSIVSSPTQQETLQFCIRVSGHYTHAAEKLKRGKEVSVRGPFGGFVFDAERDKEVVMLAGGIGIAPFISMVRFATILSAKNDIVLFYSCRSQDDIPFFKELVDMQKHNPHLRVIFAIDGGPTDKLGQADVAKGRITPELINHAVPAVKATQTYFICGPPPFMNSMIKTLLAKGVAKRKIMTEAFGQGASRQTGQVRSWPYNMYALTAVGVTLGGFVIMANDLLDNMPPQSMLDTPTNPGNTLTNSRQQDLDTLVNNLPALNSTAPVSQAVEQALAEKAAAENNQASNPTPIPSSGGTTSTPKPTPPPCTTTPSGVKIC